MRNPTHTDIRTYEALDRHFEQEQDYDTVQQDTVAAYMGQLEIMAASASRLFEEFGVTQTVSESENSGDESAEPIPDANWLEQKIARSAQEDSSDDDEGCVPLPYMSSAATNRDQAPRQAVMATTTFEDIDRLWRNQAGDAHDPEAHRSLWLSSQAPQLDEEDWAAAKINQLNSLSSDSDDEEEAGSPQQHAVSPNGASSQGLSPGWYWNMQRWLRYSYALLVVGAVLATLAYHMGVEGIDTPGVDEEALGDPEITIYERINLHDPQLDIVNMGPIFPMKVDAPPPAKEPTMWYGNGEWHRYQSAVLDTTRRLDASQPQTWLVEMLSLALGIEL